MTIETTIPVPTEDQIETVQNEAFQEDLLGACGEVQKLVALNTFAGLEAASEGVHVPKPFLDLIEGAELLAQIVPALVEALRAEQRDNELLEDLMEAMMNDAVLEEDAGGDVLSPVVGAELTPGFSVITVDRNGVATVEKF